VQPGRLFDFHFRCLLLEMFRAAVERRGFASSLNSARSRSLVTVGTAI